MHRLGKYLLALVLLTGCSLPAAGSVSSGSRESSRSEEAPEPDIHAAEPHSLRELRTKIKESGALFGTAFIKQRLFQNKEQMLEALNRSGYPEVYDFLRDFPEEQIAVTSRSESLVLIVPADADMSVSIDLQEPSGKKRPVYYSETGEPVLFAVHAGQDYVSGTVTVGGKTGYTWIPQITGREIADAGDGRVYNFTMMQGTADDEQESAFMYLLENEEGFRADIDAGMRFRFAGWEEIDGDVCFVFELGTDHEENFVREDRYALSSDHAKIYKTDPMTGDWFRIGKG